MCYEIEFRGKEKTHIPKADKNNGKWVYGYLVNENHICMKNEQGILKEIEICKETIGRFIGAKDKNKIYTGDIIIRQHLNGEKRAWIVVFKNAHYGLDPLGIGKEKWSHQNSITWDYIEVVGNFIDNPELLEGILNEYMGYIYKKDE